MNSVERVKEICKKRGIPMSKLEKDLGFGNGYIARLKKEFPADRLRKIAEYLDVSEDYLLTGEEKSTETGYYLSPETAQAAQEIFQNKELRALFDVQRDMDSEDLRAMYGMALALKRKERDSDGSDY